MDTFWELFRQSTIIQGVITLLLVASICYLAIINQPVPSFLEDITTLVIGFWFGSKVQSVINRTKG